MGHCVYILRCADDSYYVGHTHNISGRLSAHQEGTACNYTRVRRPVTLIYQENCATLGEAILRERQIKGWSRSKKESLIAGDLQRLRHLSQGSRRFS